MTHSQIYMCRDTHTHSQWYTSHAKTHTHSVCTRVDIQTTPQHVKWFSFIHHKGSCKQTSVTQTPPPPLVFVFLFTESGLIELYINSRYNFTSIVDTSSSSPPKNIYKMLIWSQIDVNETFLDSSNLRLETKRCMPHLFVHGTQLLVKTTVTNCIVFIHF